MTLQIRSPTEENATLDEAILIKVQAWSVNKRELEYNDYIDVAVRNPDIIVKNIKFDNQDLLDGTNVNITAVIENKDCYIDQVNISLYINDVLYENKTVLDLAEDSTENIEFNWQVEKYNLTNNRGRSYKFRIVANGDETVVESSYDNNRQSVRQFIGEEPPEEEINLRWLWALLSLLIIFLAIYIIYRWRKRI